MDDGFYYLHANGDDTDIEDMAADFENMRELARAALAAAREEVTE